MRAPRVDEAYIYRWRGVSAGFTPLCYHLRYCPSTTAPAPAHDSRLQPRPCCSPRSAAVAASCCPRPRRHGPALVVSDNAGSLSVPHGRATPKAVAKQEHEERRPRESERVRSYLERFETSAGLVRAAAHTRSEDSVERSAIPLASADHETGHAVTSCRVFDVPPRGLRALGTLETTDKKRRERERERREGKERKRGFCLQESPHSLAKGRRRPCRKFYSSAMFLPALLPLLLTATSLAPRPAFAVLLPPEGNDYPLYDFPSLQYLPHNSLAEYQDPRSFSEEEKMEISTRSTYFPLPSSSSSSDPSSSSSSSSSYPYAPSSSSPSSSASVATVSCTPEDLASMLNIDDLDKMIRIVSKVEGKSAKDVLLKLALKHGLHLKVRHSRFRQPQISGNYIRILSIYV